VRLHILVDHNGAVVTYSMNTRAPARRALAPATSNRYDSRGEVSVGTPLLGGVIWSLPMIRSKNSCTGRGWPVHETLEQLYVEFREHLIRILLISGVGASEDVVHEVFAKIACAPPNEPPGLPYLITATMREGQRERARAHRFPALELFDTGEPTAVGLDQAARQNGIDSAIADRDYAEYYLSKLPPAQREVVVLYAAGYSYAEIAAARDVRPKTVAAQLQHARTRLRAERERERERERETNRQRRRKNKTRDACWPLCMARTADEIAKTILPFRDGRRSNH
jgi:RNA polymerase sigma factor (sigma-70 family)